MNKFLKALLLLIMSDAVMASEGFTWLSLLKDQTALPEHVISFLIIIFLLILMTFVYRLKILKNTNPAIPDKGITLRNVIDMYGKFIFSQATMIMGEEKAKECFSFLATVFLIILCCNLTGLIPGVLPPTEHLSTTFALGVFSFLVYNYKGVKSHGVLSYIKHFAGPVWYMSFLIFPLEIVSHIIRPLTLSLRLRGNIMGDHMVLATFYKLTPIAIPIVFLFFGLLVSVLQAYVFTVLSMVYIGLATKHNH